MSSISSVMYAATGQHFGTSLARSASIPEPSLLEFNLRSYLSEYTGYAKIRRAIYVGERCPTLSIESYSIAFEELEEKTYDTTTYKHIAKLLEQLTGERRDTDEWERRVSKQVKEQDTEIRGKLERAKKQVSKKDTLQAQWELVRLQQQRGLMDESVRALQDGRTSCGGMAEQAELHMEAARVSQVMGRWLQVATYIQRTESVLPDPDETVRAELAVLRAQSDFGDGKWSAAVTGLRVLSIDTASVFARKTVTPRDIALYGTLAGLAALDRDQVKQQLLDNVQFGQFLDRMPECQALLQSYYDSKYDDALNQLTRILSFCHLDPVIGPHASALKQRIRDNIVVLYIQPFVSVRMASMATALCFGSTAQLEDTLVRMIDSGLIHARIDGTTGFLIKHTVNARDAALSRVETMHRAFAQQAELMTARIQYLEEESVRKRGARA
ncbi:hypothetical protein IWW56_002538 [Coemansia sp. RSA 2131]|nr:hypothetical protein IWW56_002538 [Coemansia sp. RSA 2131]